MKINFSVRTQVLVESVPVGHVTHMEKEEKANRFGHKLRERAQISRFFSANEWKHIYEFRGKKS